MGPEALHQTDRMRTSRDEISILALAIAAWVAAGPIRMPRITKRGDLIAAEEVPTVFDEARIRDLAKIGKLLNLHRLACGLMCGPEFLWQCNPLIVRLHVGCNEQGQHKADSRRPFERRRTK
jgi:hypothetical protein